MKKIIKKINKLYKNLYKNNKGKTKRSRYLYGSIIYKELDQREKVKIKKTIRKYKPNIKIKSRKYRKISRDLAFSKKYYKCSNDEYFMFDFYHKNDKDRKEFITGIKKREYIHMLNTDDAIEFLKNKYKTYEAFKDFYKREIIEIKDKNDYKKYEEFIKKHPKFIKKSNNLSCGKSIELIKVKEENKEKVFNRFIEEGDSTILEELVVQADTMAELHPESVNTVRIITFQDEAGSVKIKYLFLRIGVGSSVIDNGGAGGIISLIDENTGVVITDGVDEEYNWYKIHPDTAIKIKGFTLPDWDEACKLAKNAQKKMKNARLIGWDLAYTDSGWLIIEGNGHTQFIGQQIADQIGKKQPFEKMINYNKLKQNDKYKFEFSVVIPIYNAEKYLEETIESILKQTIGFKNNIELILVNDGSTDSSEKICKKYQKQYPKNIKYIYQDNQGVSKARNEGKKHITGKYVNFLDADDKWKEDAFERVKDFFELRNTRLDIVTCRQAFFENKTGYPNLDYKFKEAKSYVIDINKNPEFITLSVSSSFFKQSSLKNHEFDTRLNYGEDSKFITEILLEKEIYGIEPHAIFYLRKRNDNSSLTQNSKTDITRYTNTIEYYYKYLIKLSKEKYNFLIPYIAHVVINGLKYRISNQIPNDIGRKTKKEYINNIIELLKDLEDDIIINTRNISLNIKNYILKLKHNDKNLLCDIDSEKNIIFNNCKIGTLTGNKKLYISSINVINNNLTIKGLFKFPNYIETEEVYLLINNKRHILSFNELNSENKLSFKDEIINEIKDFTVELKNIEELTSIEAYLKTEYSTVKLAFNYEDNSKFKNKCVKTNTCIINTKNKFNIIVQKCKSNTKK